MTLPSAFTLHARDGEARAGLVQTKHGGFATPAFMPVGTHATVNSVDPDELRACGVEVVLCNAYHLALRPGVEVIERAGGLHEFMRWPGPILTDSGGYQLVSLDRIATVDDESATFVSPYDGTRMRVTPEETVRLQGRLDADIVMCLDHPVRWGTDAALTAAASARTTQWARRCLEVHPGEGRLLFGIAQGGFDAAARQQSAGELAAMGFDGYAVGGLSVGEPLEVMEAMAHESVSVLPADRPRYFMGLGTDAELLTMVALGIDMFDCVVPTRLARNGSALTDDGVLSLRTAAVREDLRPIEAGCDCAACAGFSRAYLRHLFVAGEILAHRLVTVHNLTHLSRLMRLAGEAITAGRFGAFRAEVVARQSRAGLKQDVETRQEQGAVLAVPERDGGTAG